MGPATVAVRSLCPSCTAENPPGYRFCVTCGGPLAKAARTEIAPLQPPPPPAPTLRVERAPQGAPAPAAAPQEAAPAVRVEALAASPPGHAGGAAPDKIVGAPVLDIAAARHTPVRLIECARCHGHCVAGTRFCKYCGGSLEGERPSPVPVEGGRSPAAIPVVVAPTLAGALDAESPTGGTRVSPTHPEQVMTLPSSVETAGGARPTPGPVPQRPPLPARPGGSRPDLRAVRSPEGRLVVIVEDGSEGKTFPLSGRQIDIGRVEGDILLEDDLYVSPRHARLIPHEGTWILRDLGSANRIYLRIRKPHTLQDGDLLLLGLEVLQFQTVSDGERGLGQAIQHGTLLFGSPAIQRRARLCQRTVEGVVRDVYHLHRDETVIGRETGDIVFTSDPFLSRRHAMIRRNPVSGEFMLTDLDSSNGTYIAIREDVSLVNGDFVRIGQHLFRVDLS